MDRDIKNIYNTHAHTHIHTIVSVCQVASLMQVLDCCIVMVMVPVAMMLKVPCLLALGDKKSKY